ncbi:hypothetical protein ACFS2C_03415 [Prauserella oleivorans]|uniref:Uncharacterized protein n=1 Tax=Prauserella oleivorans TaxID=1478153 RepID=A0ABW5W3S2_9PSEU
MDSSPQPETPQLGDVPSRLVTALRLKHPRVHLGIVVVLGVLVTVCLVATVTRLSPLPLLPLAAFGVAAPAAWRARTAADDRHLLGWMAVLGVGIAVGFWLLGYVGRILE